MLLLSVSSTSIFIQRNANGLNFRKLSVFKYETFKLDSGSKNQKGKKELVRLRIESMQIVNTKQGN